MDYGTVCSGIEAPTVAMEKHGWKAKWFSEIEAFPSAVLAHHYPTVPNLGDMKNLPRRILSGEVAAPSVFIGGTPCQSFSVAGMRAGLDDERGQLTKTFVEISNAIDHVRAGRGEPETVVWWENVPGVLSDKGNAFGCFLGALVGEDSELQPPGKRWENAGCVYGPQRAAAWRVLDAQYFGVAQRRRRVFVVSSARADLDPAAVLFESEGVRRDSAPSREKGSVTPRESKKCPQTKGFRMRAFGDYVNDETAGTMKARDYKDATDLVVSSQLPSVFMSDAAVSRISAAEPALGIPGNWIGRKPENSGNSVTPMLEVAPCQTRADIHGVCSAGNARRLTPRECERLQGFPDDYTLIPTEKRNWHREGQEMREYLTRTLGAIPEDEIDRLAADSPRYKAIGNSWAVPCGEFIGLRIQNHINRKAAT